MENEILTRWLVPGSPHNGSKGPVVKAEVKLDYVGHYCGNLYVARVDGGKWGFGGIWPEEFVFDNEFDARREAHRRISKERESLLRRVAALTDMLTFLSEGDC